MGVPAAVAVVAYLVNGLGPMVSWLEPVQELSPFYQYIAHDPLRNGVSGARRSGGSRDRGRAHESRYGRASCRHRPAPAGPAPRRHTSVEASGAGFWLGFWHGIIIPVTFVISLFNDNVSIYDVHNNGNWYDFGFMLGIAGPFSGIAGGSSVARR